VDDAPLDMPIPTGQLANNILYFARALREAGLPVGPGGVLDALAAVEAAGIGDKADFYATLHAISCSIRRSASFGSARDSWKN
jgi:uncharacterized protein with von Willebrand factor type A (vWA) domain